MAAVIFYAIMLLEGANDLIAMHFSISLYLTTEIARYAVFIGPALAYFITKRICLGLQRKDRDLLEHGLETGIIRQMPDGEFVELHRPVSEDTRAVILARTAPPPPPAIAAPDENGVPAPATRGIAGKLRATAYRVLTESIPLPAGNGHGNGHDGEHGDEHGDEHAAVGAAPAPDGGGTAIGPAEHGPRPGGTDS
jgi:ubiquinol-cytochrome c reductase cytochrome b subunit